jgi:Sulfotransferase family
MSDAIHIDDLRAPIFTPEVDEIRALMASMADSCVLEPEAMRRQACAEVGLDDFGSLDFEEPMDVLVAAINDWSALSAVGRTSMHAQLVQLLKNRLLLTDLLGRHPEIHEIEVVAPIVIAGLPRTGTTHLHNLIAADPAMRSLPYWESLEPVPTAAEAGIEPDPRLGRTDQAVWFMNEAMPLFPLMHEITTWHVHEEIQLLAIDFSTMFFETLAHVPAWRDHYMAHDQTPHYR